MQRLKLKRIKKKAEMPRSMRCQFFKRLNEQQFDFAKDDDNSRAVASGGSRESQLHWGC